MRFTPAGICSIVVGVLFLLSGSAKLRQPAWPATARDFGAPRWLIPVLPWVELVLGACLVAQLGEPWVPLAALAVLVTFTVAIAVHLARGDRVPCACFGETSANPVSMVTVSRNLALCALTLVAVVGPH